MERAVAYIRVSGTRQVREGNSLTTQGEQVQDYANAREYDLKRVFVDPGESAKTDQRPALQEMLAYCKANPNNVGVVIIPKIDRLARQIYDYIGLKTRLRQLGIRLESVGERLEDSPVGRFSENVIASVAQYENELRGERSRAGYLQSIREGRWVGKPPPGLRKIRFEGKWTAEPDPATAPLIIEVFERIAKNQATPPQARKWLAAMGLPLSSSSFHEMLRNKKYIGLIESCGLSVPAKPPLVPLIPSRLFFAAQEAFARQIPGRGYSSDRPDFPLRGTIRCECGLLLTACWASGRKRRYAHYRCMKCQRINHPRAVVHDRFLALLNSVRPNRKRFFRLRDLAVAHFEKVRQLDAESTADRETRIRQIRDLQKSVALQNAKGIIPDHIAKEQITDLEKEAAQMQQTISPTTSNPLTVPQLFQFAFDKLSTLGATWTKAAIEERKQIQRALFKQDLTYTRDGQFRTAKDGLFTGLFELCGSSLSALARSTDKNSNLLRRANDTKKLIRLTELLTRIYDEFSKDVEGSS